jgi:hypothetical protein
LEADVLDEMGCLHDRAGDYEAALVLFDAPSLSSASAHRRKPMY